ncbi:Metal binding domain of Ada [Mucilaginibacter pineti]|uniref:Metal binding domain of Ada n=1 Tax=Mucilaginibacter pineti TaxID=1391627 RepID=A0A1G7J2A6_9SPHI|nr:Ada metal-binding domain-containing protein [Mucilaginibacter pineti]SDF18649.1 Metal binding domain of Ada [Mucilaginibacter pineti]
MIRHTALGNTAFGRSKKLKQLIDAGEIQLAGNVKLKICGRLSCASGKRLKTENRVFFASETEAFETGYRPCGHCMKQAYQQWKMSVTL